MIKKLSHLKYNHHWYDKKGYSICIISILMPFLTQPTQIRLLLLTVFNVIYEILLFNNKNLWGNSHLQRKKKTLSSGVSVSWITFLFIKYAWTH